MSAGKLLIHRESKVNPVVVDFAQKKFLHNDYKLRSAKLKSNQGSVFFVRNIS